MNVDMTPSGAANWPPQDSQPADQSKKIATNKDIKSLFEFVVEQKNKSRMGKPVTVKVLFNEETGSVTSRSIQTSAKTVTQIKQATGKFQKVELEDENPEEKEPELTMTIDSNNVISVETKGTNLTVQTIEEIVRKANNSYDAVVEQCNQLGQKRR